MGLAEDVGVVVAISLGRLLVGLSLGLDVRPLRVGLLLLLLLALVPLALLLALALALLLVTLGLAGQQLLALVGALVAADVGALGVELVLGLRSLFLAAALGLVGVLGALGAASAHLVELGVLQEARDGVLLVDVLVFGGAVLGAEARAHQDGAVAQGRALLEGLGGGLARGRAGLAQLCHLADQALGVGLGVRLRQHLTEHVREAPREVHGHDLPRIRSASRSLQGAARTPRHPCACSAGGWGAPAGLGDDRRGDDPRPRAPGVAHRPGST